MGKSMCVWFEIPATDLDRARKFYDAVMGWETPEGREMGDSLMAFFPIGEEWENSGALTQGPTSIPCDNGVRLYLNGGDDLAAPLARVEPAGGRVLVPKTKISDEYGYFAIFADTEGNAVGLWSMG